MATILDSLKGLVHDTSSALVDNQIASKISTTVSNFIDSGMGVVDDTLKIVRDLTAPAAQPQPSDQSKRQRHR